MCNWYKSLKTRGRGGGGGGATKTRAFKWDDKTVSME